jgi:hypothetical protein
MRRGRCELRFSSSVFALMAAITCFSTSPPAQDEPTRQVAENSVISPTHIIAAGFNAPTLTTIVGSEFLFLRPCGDLSCIAPPCAGALPVLETISSGPLQSHPQQFEAKLEISREQGRFATKDS